MEPSISVIIPAYNEENRIGKTLESLQSLKEINEIVVVDDGSTDNTSQVAAKLCTQLVSLDKNSGKGAALNKALEHIKGDIIAILDADLGESVLEVKKLLKPVLEGKADIAIASFPVLNVSKKGGFGIVKGFARWILRRFYGQNIQEPLSGQRALTRNALEKITPFAEGFGVEMAANILALKRGLRVVEVPTHMTHRITGRNIRGFSHRGRQLFDILKALVKLNFWRMNP